MARLRGYDSVLHAKLSPNNIPVEVFHNLIGHLPQAHPNLASILGCAAARARL